MSKTFSYTDSFTLHNDESSLRKIELGADKWEIIQDDARNPDCTKYNDDLEKFLEIGKSYKITVLFEELP